METIGEVWNLHTKSKMAESQFALSDKTVVDQLKLNAKNKNTTKPTQTWLSVWERWANERKVHRQSLKTVNALANIVLKSSRSLNISRTCSSCWWIVRSSCVTGWFWCGFWLRSIFLSWLVSIFSSWGFLDWPDGLPVSPGYFSSCLYQVRPVGELLYTSSCFPGTASVCRR